MRNDDSGRRDWDRFDLDALLHPAQAFGHPSEVLCDPDLTLNEKRAILASWASDACAIEAAPELRRSPLGPPVRFDEVMDALRALDCEANALGMGHRSRPRARRLAIFGRGREESDDHGAPLN